MSLSERWDAEENKFGKFLKFVLGYLPIIAGVVTDVTVNYLPAVAQYVPESVSHIMVSVGVICYTIGKLTTNVQK